MESTLAPGIVVLNQKYFPAAERSAAQVGSSSFTFSVLKVLSEADILSGIVLYRRDEDLTAASYHAEGRWNGIPVVTVHFHFRMSRLIIASVLEGAFNLSLNQTSHMSAPIVYYQTDTLLPYHPTGSKFCVTHHGPLVSHFVGQFSLKAAQLAFGGDPEKVAVLFRQQREGHRRLLMDKRGTVLVHSRLQQQILEHEGLEPSRFQVLRPPVGVPRCRERVDLSQQIKEFVESSQMLLFTAVARVDYFKNVDLLVETCLALIARGRPARLLVIGDPENDSTRRQALLASVPADKRKSFLVLPRFPKDHLYTLFALVRSKAIFLCPSRYETLGITPLEAAACGVTTFITESPNIGALAFLPPRCRVGSDAESIADSVEDAYQDGIQKSSAIIETYVRKRTSLEGFRQDLLNAWAKMSKGYVAGQYAPLKVNYISK
ncbi:hypothetical protein CDV36_015582 [Fusarium kuroshium]|uniref:Glycosyl transferase family 1 domain-containing protein n=1 Tax=Fusarium kuroshium TaxID=2010991 RepID=A0A3M2R9C3_9HYPO|nr:hypothetical protein CDV36_015582 [Fusarium kuroshium]